MFLADNERLRPSVDQFARRAFDMLVAGSALVLLSPLVLLVSLAILLESGRPILHSQLRIGRFGHPFRIYKFRKFHARCGDDGMPLTLTEDDRMTRVGRMLRATKLDELPQLWNVIEGSMSLVGPRPESLAFADCFTAGYERVLDYKPGIFGLSQAIYRNESELYSTLEDPGEFYRRVLFPAKARIDLNYYARRTLRSDAYWLFRCGLSVAGVSIPQCPDALRPEDEAEADKHLARSQ